MGVFYLNIAFLQAEMRRVEFESAPLDTLVKMDAKTGLRILPYWLAQPYFRPLPEQKVTLLADTSVELSTSITSSSNAMNLASTSTSTNSDQDVEAIVVPSSI